MSEHNFYIGYKPCDCPVVAVNADVASPHDLAVSLAEMIEQGYTVKKSIGLPDAFLYDTCEHGIAPLPSSEGERPGQNRG